MLEPDRLEAERMHALLAVARGSDRPPRLVVLRHRRGDGPTLALVGKGVTFDSGGLSLKTTEQMVDMKCDMAGAAAVLGAMQADRRAEPAGQRRRRDGAGREHAERPGDEAGRRAQGAQRQDHRGAQHRRRGPADPGRRAGLRRRPEGEPARRSGDADRGVHGGAGLRGRRPDEQRRGAGHNGARRPRRPPASAPGRCRCFRSTAR